MRTVASLIRELQRFPPYAVCHVYEGERCGVTVMDPSAKDQIGFVDAGETKLDESGIVAEFGDLA